MVDILKAAHIDLFDPNNNRVVRFENKCGESGSGSGGAATVKTPTNLSPSGTDITLFPVLSASAYSCQVATDLRAYREFQLSTDNFKSFVINVQENADSYSVTKKLSLSTTYQFRCRDVSQWGAESEWSEVAQFTTTSVEMYINVPTVTVTGQPDQVIENPTITASAFTVTDGEDTHVSTTWQVYEQGDDASPVWQSEDDPTNKTSITIPKGYLQAGKTYIFKVTYKGFLLGAVTGQTTATTKAKFAEIQTPTLTVAGAPDAVLETPLLSLTTFTVTPSDYQDTHYSTDWKILLAGNDSEVWSSLGDTTNKLTITVPAGKLQANNSYKFMARFNGTTMEPSGWATVTASTVTSFATITAPTVTVTGAPSNIPECPTISLSEFTVTPSQYSDTHVSTDWEIRQGTGDALVWQSLGDATNKTSITVPATKLLANTQYKFRARFNGATYPASAWGEYTGSTMPQYPAINTPTITVEGSPSNVPERPTLTGSTFSAVATEETHTATDWVIEKSTGGQVWSSMNDTTNKTSIKVPNSALQVSTTYTFKCRYHTASLVSDWATASATTKAEFAYIEKPTLSVTGSPNRVPACPVMRGGDFTVVTEDEITDTHESSDWAVYDATGSALIWQSENDKTNLTTCRVPYGYLQESATYIFKVRYKGATLGYTDWVQVQATCMDKFSTIGIPGTAGFGVGVFPGTQAQLTALGLTEAGKGTYDPTSEDYGLYKGSFGNVRFIPKFYYKVGYTETDATDVFYSQDPSFPEKGATYAANALAIVGSETFSSEAEANEAGYVLHRAFIDGGEEQDGFFIDEFIASRGTDGTSTTAQSVANGKIISFTRLSSFTNSSGMTSECNGLIADAITLSKTRGGQWNCPSIFMYSALAMLSLCHGEFSSSDAYCAWYDSTGTTNYPKGCNNSALGDTDDASIVYITCGDSGQPAKPLTGSCNYPAKAAHNGQLCGVKDLNGCAWEASVGCFTDSGTQYIYNDDAKLADFTRDMATTRTVTLFHSTKWSFGDSWGNGDNAALYNDASGDNRALCGCYAKEGGFSRSGTNLFGKDVNTGETAEGFDGIGFTCLTGGSFTGWGDGSWSSNGYGSHSQAGVFARDSNCDDTVWGGRNPSTSFRSAAYPPAS